MESVAVVYFFRPSWGTGVRALSAGSDKQPWPGSCRAAGSDERLKSGEERRAPAAPLTRLFLAHDFGDCGCLCCLWPGLDSRGLVWTFSFGGLLFQLRMAKSSSAQLSFSINLSSCFTPSRNFCVLVCWWNDLSVTITRLKNLRRYLMDSEVLLSICLQSKYSPLSKQITVFSWKQDRVLY